MQIGEWKKKFGIGLIILLLEVSSIPHIYANVNDVKTGDTNITDTTEILTYIIVGKIREKKN